MENISSCKEKLKNIPPQDNCLINRVSTISEESLKNYSKEVENEVSNPEENAKIAQEAYSFEETPIFIPENLKHRRIDSSTTDEPMAKQSRMDYVESNEEKMDVETMMKDLVY